MYNYIVIDDDAGSNMICEVLIKKYLNPNALKTFIKPQEALEYITDNYQDILKGYPTIVLLDINMPGMTGWEFLDAFVEFDPEIQDQFRIYMLSSSVDQSDIKRANEHKNVIDYIVKPLTKDKMTQYFGE